jgi:hypothetical protein
MLPDLLLSIRLLKNFVPYSPSESGHERRARRGIAVAASVSVSSRTWRRSSLPVIRNMVTDCSVPASLAVAPTNRLQEVRPPAPGTLAAQMTRAIAPTALAALGLSHGSFHESFHVARRATFHEHDRT